MKPRLALLASATIAATSIVTGSAASSTPAPAAKTAAALTPVLTCGPTSTAGIWGCWNNVAGKYVLTFPADMLCPNEDSCYTTYWGGTMDRWDVRYG